jgi:hypothetical protein
MEEYTAGLEENLENINTGVQLLQRPEDWVLGGESGVVLKTRIESGDWSDYLPSEERQYTKKTDTLACTNFSWLNSVETQVNFLVRTKQIEGEKLEALEEMGFFDADYKFNCSDRFLAKISGTGTNGNYMVNSPDAVRKGKDAKGLGLLPEKDWPTMPEMSWEEFYAEIPQELMEKAKKVLEILDFKYQWIPLERVPEALKTAPVTIAAPCCPGWYEAEVKTCPSRTAQHCTMIYGTVPSGYRDFDHYQIFKKVLAKDYPILAIMQTVVTPVVVPEEPMKPKHVFLHNMQEPYFGEEVRALQQALKYYGFFKLEPTGYYGPRTKEAVSAFQLAYKEKILLPLGLIKPTGRFYEASRKCMNELLAS